MLLRKSLLLCAILCIAFWIRILSVDAIPDEHFTGIDPYLYYWHAQIISEHGQLPERDMHRWLPLGRDLGQTLNLYGYVLAYTHKALTWVFPSIRLYHVSVYMPVVCFCIGLGALCLFLYQTHGWLFSGIVGILLATLPGSIERSAAGFGDRDAFCLMLGSKGFRHRTHDTLTDFQKSDLYRTIIDNNLFRPLGWIPQQLICTKILTSLSISYSIFHNDC